jgi:hypothetical protein
MFWVRSVSVFSDVVIFFSWIVILTPDENFWFVQVLHSVSDISFTSYGVLMNSLRIVSLVLSVFIFVSFVSCWLFCYFLSWWCAVFWVIWLLTHYINGHIIIIIIIIILVITVMQSIYNYIPETNHVSRVYAVAAVLYLQFVLHAMLFRTWNMFCTFTLALPAVCVQCPIRLFFVVL